nr:MAG TPA: Mucin-1-catalytic proteolysis, STRUCTURAL PROTEIN [Caudoviricetes sp.]
MIAFSTFCSNSSNLSIYFNISKLFLQIYSRKYIIPNFSLSFLHYIFLYY